MMTIYFHAFSSVSLYFTFVYDSQPKASITEYGINGRLLVMRYDTGARPNAYKKRKIEMDENSVNPMVFRVILELAALPK